MTETYAQSVTGMFHTMDSPETTTCGDIIAEDDSLRVVPADVALDWLSNHQWDLCRNCKRDMDAV